MLCSELEETRSGSGTHLERVEEALRPVDDGRGAAGLGGARPGRTGAASTRARCAAPARQLRSRATEAAERVVGVVEAGPT